jgi:hypothetical protein
MWPALSHAAGSLTSMLIFAAHRLRSAIGFGQRLARGLAADVLDGLPSSWQWVGCCLSALSGEQGYPSPRWAATTRPNARRRPRKCISCGSWPSSQSRLAENGFPLSKAASREIVGGDLVGAAIALVAVIALLRQSELGSGLLGLVVVETVVDLAVAIRRRRREPHVAVRACRLCPADGC